MTETAQSGVPITATEAQADERCTGVENGRRVEFTHPSSAGRAGLVNNNGRITLAYTIDRTGGKPPAIGDTITLEGDSYKVLEVKVTKAPAMYRLRLEALAAA